MPKKPSTAATAIYTLKIFLLDLEPEIWRTIEVKGETTLAKLHEIVQAAFGWENCHMHLFKVGKTLYGVPIDDDFGLPTEDERNGQLGDGTTSLRLTPLRVSGLTNVTAIAAGYGHTVALKQDGTVWAFGDNNDGQLGGGTSLPKSTPVQVSGLTNVTAIAAGFEHTVALKQDGTVWAFGDNFSGQLGDGTTSRKSTPTTCLREPGFGKVRLARS